MSNKILVLILIASLAIFPSVVLAAGSVSITSISIPSSVTQGDSFTITMSVSSSSASNVQGSLTLPSTISCTPTGSNPVTSGSASWTCSANVAGDYTSGITASVTATDSDTGGALSDSRQTGLTVLSPASLTASSVLASSSVSTSSSTTFTVGINNLGDTSTTFNITCGASGSGCSCSPSSVANTAITGKSLSNNQFTVSGTSAGTCTFTATIKSPVQADLTTSQSLTVTAVSEEITGGGGGGGAAAAEKTKTTVTKSKADATIPSIAKGKSAEVSINKTFEAGVRKIEISVKNAVSNIKITIEKLSGAPAAVTKEIVGKVYHYVEITKENITDADINKTKINFAVEKSWIDTNKIDSATIALNRWANNMWNKLTTTKVSETDTEIEYQAESPGLSYFAISGEEIAVEELPPEEELPPGEVPEEEITEEVAAAPAPTYWIAAVVIIIALVAGIWYFYYKPKKKK